LGETPLADRLLTADQLRQPEIMAPLDLVFCPHCSLVQISVSISPEILFCSDYPYFSSVSASLMQHFRESAIQLRDAKELGAESLVVEVASNDGYMLKNFLEFGVPVLGIDPADGPAAAAEKCGVPTLNTFFTGELARKLRKEQGVAADVFLANNVLAHVPDLNGFVEGIRVVLKKTGVAVIEVPYIVDLVNKLEFDTIYHQHLCYFSATALDRLFRRHGLFLNDVARVPIHGGSSLPCWRPSTS
jgi:SAM-dependent methyltransferase